MSNLVFKTNDFVFPAIGWKYYKSLKKKAVEQEFSWSGLVISLSIAFFIVIISALALNLLYQSLNNAGQNGRLLSEEENIYRLEIKNGLPALNNNYLYPELFNPAKETSYNTHLESSSVLS